MSPRSNRRTNASRTARDSAGESVYAVRVQSADAPMARSCERIVPPVSFTCCAVRATKASRPRSKRVFPSLASAFSTTFCVAMPAWSVPGTQSASSPLMRRQRITTSCTVLLSPCPMWSTAVTLGGGMTMVYGSRSPAARRERSAWAVKTPASCQRAYRSRSVAAWSYCGGSSEVDMARNLTWKQQGPPTRGGPSRTACAGTPTARLTPCGRRRVPPRVPRHGPRHRRPPAPLPPLGWRPGARCEVRAPCAPGRSARARRRRRRRSPAPAVAAPRGA
jgi:hypothetical protein